MSPINPHRLLVVLSALFFALGCASTSSVPASEAAEEPVASKKSNDTEIAAGEVRTTLDSVYFDTAEAALRPEARDLLKEHALLILAHPEWGVVTINGHCDERGSELYNHELGERRAAAVERYLVEMGVSPDRVVVRTFGADRPAVAGHDERAWKYNRRSELQPEALTSASL
jgi:peptidoglycan-associated lipoprotein